MNATPATCRIPLADMSIALSRLDAARASHDIRKGFCWATRAKAIRLEQALLATCSPAALTDVYSFVAELSAVVR